MEDQGTPPAPEAAPAAAPAAPGPSNLREDQIASAVAFLTHPKVRSSPESTKRSFLERKGLTQEEIDEAFRRAPPQEAAPAPPATPAAATPPAAAPQSQPLVTYAQPLQQQPYGAMQQQLQPYGGPMQPHMMQPPQPEPIRWTQVLLGLSIVGGAAFAAVHYVAPTVVGWYRTMSESREKQRRAAAERDEALAAALEAMAATQQRLATAVEELASAVGRGDGGGGISAAAARSPGVGGALASGAHGGALGWNGDAPTFSPASSSRRPRGPQYADDPYSTLSAAADGRLAALGGSSRSSPQRGARFGGGVPPSPPASVSASAPTPVLPSRGANGSSGALGLAAASATQQPFQQQPYQSQQQPQQQESRPDDAPHSQAFLDIMAMVARGETPPNVRTDINDAPPDPTRAPSESRLRPKPKPWEAAAGTGGADGDAASGTKPWGDSAAGYAAGDAGWAARNPAVGGSFGGSPVPGSTGSGRPVHTDLSTLLGGHDARDAPWRPPPPPAPTVAAKPASVADEAVPVAAAAAVVPDMVVNGEVAVVDVGGKGEDAAREAAARVAAAAVQAVVVGAEAPAY